LAIAEESSEQKSGPPSDDLLLATLATNVVSRALEKHRHPERPQKGIKVLLERDLDRLFDCVGLADEFVDLSTRDTAQLNVAHDTCLPSTRFSLAQPLLHQRLKHRISWVFVELDADLRPKFIWKIIKLPASRYWHQQRLCLLFNGKLSNVQWFLGGSLRPKPGLGNADYETAAGQH
jgi:hypothetical protein